MYVDIETTDKKYGLILADPPWKQAKGGKKSKRPNSSGKQLDYEDDPDYKEAVDTVEKAAEILTPKKPLPDDRYYGNGMCPNCKAVFMDKDTNFCGNCGQALNWSGTEVRTE